jgi:polyhydroxyalkanoate synthase
VPSRDRIVPPASALKLAAALPGAAAMRPPLGHIGMMASGRAPAAFWPGLIGWIRAHAAS